VKKHKSSLLIVILTGLSGSGKSIALRAFEDSGFFCVDNMPSSLIRKLVDLISTTPSTSKIAVGIDIRERKFLSDFSETVSALRKRHKVEIIFLEALDEVLIRRFKETRRPHPLGYKDLKKALHREAALLAPIRKEADKIIDSSALTPHQLRKLVTESYLNKGRREMSISIMSFGYKYGVPKEADLLFDVRFLPNPYFIPKLKPFPGTSANVRKFILSQNDTKLFFDKLNPLLDHVIPLYKKEGRSYLTIGIGCTGGRHRSPVISEEIRKRLEKNKLNVSLIHRDIHYKT
jgi:UPF0042 nucleotide-binding protein